MKIEYIDRSYMRQRKTMRKSALSYFLHCALESYTCFFLVWTPMKLKSALKMEAIVKSIFFCALMAF